MKVAFSIEGGTDLRSQLCPAFGRAPRFLVHDLETGTNTLLDNTAAGGAHGAGTGAAALISQAGADAIVSGRFGPNAFQALGAAGIRMYADLTGGTVEAVLDRFRRGLLREAAAG